MKGVDMSWEAIENHLFEKYCVEGEDKKLCNLMSEHDIEIRNKSIDEFVKEIEAEYDNDGCPNVTDYLDYKISIRDLHKIAEEMRGAT
jgi:hypothetical protein